MAEADKVILNRFYAAQPAHSYFNGCSQGGHEAMIEAQRYPNDFDGIVAGDPANNWTRHYIGGHLWNALAVDGDGYLTQDKVQILADAVNAQCDALDGVKDGVLMIRAAAISVRRRCSAKVRTPRSASQREQVAAVEKIWSGLRTPEGQLIYPGLVPGGEAGTGGWAAYITGNGPGKGRHALLSAPFFRFFVFDDPAWDYATSVHRRRTGSTATSTNGHEARGAVQCGESGSQPIQGPGGKLIHYHGWSDPDITPLNSINYYESVVKAQGGDANGLAKHGVLPPVHGAGHVALRGRTGGHDIRHDGALAIGSRRERPRNVIASHLANGKVERTRPLCPYPMEAEWKGTGSTDDAANFVCALPKQ